MSSPHKQGLYDSSNEHENCGIGLIVDMKGRKSHDIVSGALEICVNLDHREVADVTQLQEMVQVSSFKLLTNFLPKLSQKS